MHMSEVERIVDVADARSLEFTMQPGRILFLEMEGRLYRLKELRGHMSVRQRVLCRLSQDCVLHVLRERSPWNSATNAAYASSPICLNFGSTFTSSWGSR